MHVPRAAHVARRVHPGHVAVETDAHCQQKTTTTPLSRPRVGTDQRTASEGVRTATRRNAGGGRRRQPGAAKAPSVPLAPDRGGPARAYPGGPTSLARLELCCPEGDAPQVSDRRSSCLLSTSTPLLNAGERTAIVPEVPVPALTATTSPRTRNGSAPARSAMAHSHRGTAQRRSARESWAAWRATGSETDAIHFCESVLPWMEGTSAQLARPVWPSGGVRPTMAAVQARLREALGFVLTHEAAYIDALDAARRRVAPQLSGERARDAAR